MNKVYWVSRHDLSPAQIKAVRLLHGEDVEIIKDPVVLEGPDGLKKYLEARRLDEFVYAVASAVHYLTAASAAYEFGIFENHSARREDGSFGLSAVYHVGPLWHNEEAIEIRKVWENPDPLSDEGEALAPVLHA